MREQRRVEVNGAEAPVTVLVCDCGCAAVIDFEREPLVVEQTAIALQHPDGFDEYVHESNEPRGRVRYYRLACYLGQASSLSTDGDAHTPAPSAEAPASTSSLERRLPGSASPAERAACLQRAMARAKLQVGDDLRQISEQSRENSRARTCYSRKQRGPLRCGERTRALQRCATTACAWRWSRARSAACAAPAVAWRPPWR